MQFFSLFPDTAKIANSVEKNADVWFVSVSVEKNADVSLAKWLSVRL